MESLVSYDSSSSSASSQPGSPSAPKGSLARPSRAVLANPSVNSAALGLSRRRQGDFSVALRASDGPAAQNGLKALTQLLKGEGRRNLPAAVMAVAPAGPKHPWKKDQRPEVNGVRNMATGGVLEPAAVEAFDFEEQFNSYNSRGYAVDAYGRLQGDATVARKRQRDLEAQPKAGAKARAKRRAERRGPDGSLLPPEDVIDEVDKESSEAVRALGAGPWADSEDLRAAAAASAATQAQAKDAGDADDDAEPRGRTEEEDFDHMVERKRAHLLPPRHNRHTQAAAATSTFHGEAARDYGGRSWAAPPKGVRADPDGEHDVFLPKRCVHTFRGHSKGVNQLRWAPQHGHLLLSASMDGTARVWDAYDSKRCMRTYAGHSLGIKAVDFAPGGDRFLTASFDRFVRYWDLETGAALQTLSNRKMVYDVAIHPQEPDLFLAACSDNKVLQYDLRSGDIVQEYNYHLEAVNSVCYVDGNRRFVSTSDDKKILVWEWGLPVPMKYISEPDMFSVHSATLAPTGNLWVGHSMNNSIVCYQATPKFKQMGRKTMRGLINAGYALGLGFSPNAKYLVSGDAEGRALFYHFATGRLVKKIRAHDRGTAGESVCFDTKWHPLEPSWVATAGWDGLVKLWE